MKKSSQAEEKPADDPETPEKKIEKPNGSPKKLVRPQEKQSQSLLLKYKEHDMGEL